jgi:D-sedoheptulose 7-phosphate isomerase
MAVFSAYANDEGYENVFCEQLVNLLVPDDIVIAISASGNSKNIVNAIQYAKSQNAFTIGFTGFDGGILGTLVDINLHINSNIIEHVEDLHLVLEHMIVKSLKERVYSETTTPILVEDVQTPR